MSELQQPIAALLSSFGYSDVDRNAVEMLQSIGEIYIRLCGQYRDNPAEGIVQGLQYVGNSCSNLLKFSEKFNYLASLEDEYEVFEAEIDFEDIPFQEIFTGNMTENLE